MFDVEWGEKGVSGFLSINKIESGWGGIGLGVLD